MANFLPPGFGFPPPPPWWKVPPPPPPSWRSTSSYPDDSPSTSGALIAAVSLPIVLILLCGLICICANAARPPPAPSSSVPAESQENSNDDEEQQLRDDDCRRPRRAGPNKTAGLPSFTYTLSLKHNVTGDDEEAATTCSVCLGALEVGETVRLLPVCMHLYHVDCIDPWLDAHSTCPICRSGTMDEGPRIPPV
ncbi:hypothetical protein PR202_gb27618 [Eleusine coracana subsp. coracana]|uniref:RING-type E3 ubiquitin transferase n=1 Tax=Eleusine coracana subsp. coracana TaxID=191504 RepID=A0AAV5FS55_ELECO|nr:hypothetical protein QOZ80_6AG0542090 [Eleusine coracana subsp. coracana]GJN38563.1 hypothetical protein PR202_gb27618 [Eleusine coracana subsp. coracana]